MPYFLAIDAGGTKTNCLLADSERILAHASTGTVKLMRVSIAEATSRLRILLTEVAASASVPLSQITRTCFGLAGLTIPAVRNWATTNIVAQVSGSLILCGDEEIALDAAFSGDSGILVIAGTGSNIIGRAPSGSLLRAGGWGPVLGDEGSGTWIGLEGIRAALRARDRDPNSSPSPSPEADPSTLLLAEIQRAWNLNSLAELVDLGNHQGDASRTAPDFASLAPIIAYCAEQGNPIAAAVLSRAGEDLASLVALVARKLIASSTPSISNLDSRTPTLQVAFTGSVLTHITPVRAAMLATLAQTLPAAQIQQTPVDPLDGALWRARNF